MFLLVNTFVAGPDNRGAVLSRHRTTGAAFDAMARQQRAVQRVHGARSWLPMIVVEVDANDLGRARSWVPRGMGRLIAEPEV